jgi:transcriptional regulator with XRE-family HTH domain
MPNSGDALKDVRKKQRERTAHVWNVLRASGMKRKFIAKHLGVSYNYLNQVQYGQMPLSKPLRKKLSAFLGIPQTRLFADLDAAEAEDGKE